MVVGALARLPPARARAVAVDRDVRVAMRDGAVLLADRWVGSPARAGAPVVLARTPYGRRSLGLVGRLFAERGYQVVIQSCRGTFGSDGQWDPFRHERDDGHDTLAWLAAQPWFGGTLATFGPSYLGLVQWALCDDPPPWLAAIAPALTASSFRDAVVYPGGDLALESLLAWVHQLEHQELPFGRLLLALAGRRRAMTRAASSLPLSAIDGHIAGQPVGYVRDWLTHDGPGDPWWEPADFRRVRHRAPPATFLGGWYDMFLPAQLDDFVALRAAGRPARLTVGPWTHMSLAAMGAGIRDALEWFDRHAAGGSGLRQVAGEGEGEGAQDRGGGATGDRCPGVRLFVMGSRRWVDLPDWPPPATIERWHLHPGGALMRDGPRRGEPDRFRFDPANPTPGIGGPSLDVRNAGRKDQRMREGRSDVLCYTSAPLPHDVTVAGPLATDLWFRSSVEHTDVSVRLCAVSAKGRSTNVSDGYLRLPAPGVSCGADGINHVRVEMWPTAFAFRRGERVRLQVASGAHPLFARNLGTGEPLWTATRLQGADQEVFHDPIHPSGVELPISTI